MRQTLIAMIAAIGLVLIGSVPTVKAAGPADGYASYEAEYDALHTQLLSDPGNLDLMARFAYVATRLERYEAAIMTFERMLLINPNLPGVQLEIGALHYRLGDYQQAKAYLEAAHESPDAPPGSRTRAERYLDAVDDRLDGHTASGYIMAGFRYQTNANQGNDLFMTPAFAVGDDANFFLSGRIDDVWDLGTPYDEDWQTSVYFYGAKQFELSELDVGYLEVNSGPRFALMPNSIDGLSIRPFAIANATVADGGFFQGSIGGGGEIEQRYGNTALAGLRYYVLYRSFMDQPAFPANSTQSGFEHHAELYGVYRLTEALAVRASGGFTDVMADAAFQAHDRYHGGASVDYRYDDPFFGTPWMWRFSVGGQYVRRDYDGPDPVFSPPTRVDDEFRISASNNFQITRDWSIYLLVQYTNNNSNLPAYDFDNVSTTVAARRRF